MQEQITRRKYHQTIIITINTIKNILVSVSKVVSYQLLAATELVKTLNEINQ